MRRPGHFHEPRQGGMCAMERSEKTTLILRVGIVALLQIAFWLMYRNLRGEIPTTQVVRLEGFSTLEPIYRVSRIYDVLGTISCLLLTLTPFLTAPKRKLTREEQENHADWERFSLCGFVAGAWLGFMSLQDVNVGTYDGTMVKAMGWFAGLVIPPAYLTFISHSSKSTRDRHIPKLIFSMLTAFLLACAAGLCLTAGLTVLSVYVWASVDVLRSWWWINIPFLFGLFGNFFDDRTYS